MSRLHQVVFDWLDNVLARRHDLRRERRHPLLVLYDAALNGDFDAAAELIDDACEYVMMPHGGLTRETGCPKAMGRGAGAFDRTAHRQSPSMSRPQNGSLRVRQ